MKKKLLSAVLGLFVLANATFAQKISAKKVPAKVRAVFAAKYPEVSQVIWEKEKENYEANWGGRENEDNSVQFTKAGEFIEIVKAIPVSELLKPIRDYVKQHYKNSKITEAGKVTDAQGKTWYEAEVNKKDNVFDENGKFVKVEK